MLTVSRATLRASEAEQCEPDHMKAAHFGSAYQPAASYDVRISGTVPA